jgi:hypothetical protein
MWWLKAKAGLYHHFDVRRKRGWFPGVDLSRRPLRPQKFDVRKFSYCSSGINNHCLLCQSNYGRNRFVYFNLWNSKRLQHLLLLYIRDRILIVSVEILSSNSTILWSRCSNQCFVVFRCRKLENHYDCVLSRSFGLHYRWNHLHSERYTHLLSHKISCCTSCERLPLHC